MMVDANVSLRIKKKLTKLHLEIRKRLVRCYVLPTFLYTSELCTLDKQMEDKINAFEMLIFRRMSRYHIWTERLMLKF